MVGTTGFEPATSRTPSVRATRLRYVPTGVKHLLLRGHSRVDPLRDSMRLSPLANRPIVLHPDGQSSR
jgi:hypothetical protein